MCTVIDHKKVRHETKSSGVTVVLYYSRHTRKNVHLIVLYSKNSNGLLKDFWGMKKEKQVR